MPWHLEKTNKHKNSKYTKKDAARFWGMRRSGMTLKAMQEATGIHFATLQRVMADENDLPE